jgi:hypothetical protein
MRMPVTFLMKNRAMITAMIASTMKVRPANPKAPARPPGAPAQCRKYAYAKHSSMTPGKTMTTPSPTSPPAVATRVPSIFSSRLARAISYLMSEEMSLAASATRSPSDGWSLALSGFPLRTMACSPLSAGVSQKGPGVPSSLQVNQGYRSAIVSRRSTSVTSRQ